jgi:probable HAF family extracellular repeat protein
MGISNRSMPPRRPVIPVLFTALLGFAAPSLALDYTFVPLAKLIEGSDQYRWGDQSRLITNSNQILVAKELGENGLGYLVDWSGPSGAYTPLESMVGGNTYEVSGLNNQRHLAGSYLTPGCSSCSNAFKQEGGTQTLLDSAGSNARATAINDHGQVVGYTYTENSFLEGRAALWTGSTLTNLDTLGGPSSARDINNHGTIVGSSKIGTNPDDPYHAVAWRNGAIQDLGTLGGTRSWATAINDNNLIAGYASRADETIRPVVWDNNGVIVDLLGANSVSFGVAEDVNAHGIAVGRFGSEPRAALWQDGFTVDLNHYLTGADKNDWILRNARSINDKGWIVGDAMNMSFEQYAFVLIPSIPEPSNYVMFMAGLAMLGAALRRVGKKQNACNAC